MHDTKTARIEWIDFLRGIAILIVVLGHTNVPFMKYIYGFHMPLFYIITGMLYKYKNNMSDKDYIKSIATKYLKPYFVFAFINLLLCTVIDIILDRPSKIVLLKQICKYVVGILYSRGSTQFMPNCSPLWFLTSVFCLLVMFRYIEKVNNKALKQTIIFLLACISITLSAVNAPKLFWNIDTAMMAVLFMYIGTLVGTCGEIRRQEYLNISRKAIFVLISASIIGILSIKYNPTEIVSFDDNSYGDLLLMLTGSIAISFVIITICYWLQNKMNNIISKYIIWLGKNTIFIMSVDYFSNTLACYVIPKDQWLLVFFLKLVIISISLIIYKIFIYSVINICQKYKCD